MLVRRVVVELVREVCKVGLLRLQLPRHVDCLVEAGDSVSKAQKCMDVGYYFARRLHRRLRIPIGIIDTSWGGTMAQHWVSTETLRPFPEMKSYFDDFEAKVKAWSEGGGEEGARKRLAADIAAWEKKRGEAKAKGEREPRRPAGRRQGQMIKLSRGLVVSGVFHCKRVLPPWLLPRLKSYIFRAFPRAAKRPVVRRARIPGWCRGTGHDRFIQQPANLVSGPH